MTPKDILSVIILILCLLPGCGMILMVTSPSGSNPYEIGKKIVNNFIKSVFQSIAIVALAVVIGFAWFALTR